MSAAVSLLKIKPTAAAPSWHVNAAFGEAIVLSAQIKIGSLSSPLYITFSKMRLHLVVPLRLKTTACPSWNRLVPFKLL